MSRQTSLLCIVVELAGEEFLIRADICTHILALLSPRMISSNIKNVDKEGNQRWGLVVLEEWGLADKKGFHQSENYVLNIL